MLGQASKWLRPALALLATLSPIAARAGACPTSGGETATIATVEPRLELRLADGRLLRLVGLDPPSQTPADPDLAETARTRVAAMATGKAVTLTVLAREPDRWGRLPAFVFLGPATPGGLAAGLIADGLGRYLAEPAARDCRTAFLDGEAKARSATLGLWSDPYYAVLAVDDRAGFVERSGTTVLVEGRLTEARPGPYRTLLRFAGAGSFGGHMLVATITPRAMKSFEAQHMDVRTLIGRRLRFRGLLDLRFGPRIELDTPDAVEVLDAPAAAVAPQPN